MSKTFLCCFVLACAGISQAQPIQAGLKLGTTVNDFYKVPATLSATVSRHILFGPYLEVRLPAGLGVEVDALYETTVLGSLVPNGTQWQFPVLLKYRLGLGNGFIKPYVSGGVSFSRLSDIKQIPALKNQNNFGVVAAVGLQIHVLVLRLSPEIRYTGWTRKSLADPTGLFELNKNQAMFMLGIGF